MIEFKNDGPFQTPESEENLGCVVLGVGGAGVSVLDQLVLEEAPDFRMIALDTCETCIEGSVVAEKLLMGDATLHGVGAQGDPELGTYIFNHEREVLAQALSGTKLAVIIVGIGGGTGSGMAVPLAEMLREMGAETVFLTLQPWSFEGERRKQQARKTVAALRSVADVVMSASTERLVSLEEGFSVREMHFLMDRIAGMAAGSVVEMLTRRGMLMIELEDFKSFVADSVDRNDFGENCWIGVAEAQGEDRMDLVVDGVLGSPCLHDGHGWKAGKQVLVQVVGGADMSMVEFETLLASLKDRMPVEMPMLAGTVLDEKRERYIKLTLIVVGSETTVKIPVAEVEEVDSALFEMPMSHEPIGEPSQEEEVISEATALLEMEEAQQEKLEEQDDCIDEEQEIVADHQSEKVVEETEVESIEVTETVAHENLEDEAKEYEAEESYEDSGIEEVEFIQKIPVPEVTVRIDELANEPVSGELVESEAPTAVVPVDELPECVAATEPHLKEQTATVLIENSEETKEGTQRYFASQEELPFSDKELKGRFAKSQPTLHEGEDLDLPTFMRLGINVRL